MKTKKTILCLSDIHGQIPKIIGKNFDLVVIAGDLCGHRPWRMKELHPLGGLLDQETQWNFLKEKFIPFVDSFGKPVVVIAGNHDFVLQKEGNLITQDPTGEFRAMSKNMVYLNENSEIVDGIKFFGSPWTPHFYSWAYNFPKEDKDYIEFANGIYSKIPDDVDVLVTHGPQHYILDKVEDHISPEGVTQYLNVGCRVLKQHMHRKKNLKAHIFGHIHPGYGIDKRTHEYISVNAAMCNDNNNLVKQPLAVTIEV